MRILLAVLITAVLVLAGVAVAQSLPEETDTVRHVKGDYACQAVIAVDSQDTARVQSLRCRLER